MLTPLDIHNKEFKKSLRGYDLDDVDMFLDEIIKDFETMYRDNSGLKQDRDRLKEQVDSYKSMETNLNKALILAEETSNKVKAEAKIEADKLLHDARMEAERIIKQAKIDSENFNEANLGLIEKSKEFKAGLKGFLEQQIKLIENNSDLKLIGDFENELKKNEDTKGHHIVSSNFVSNIKAENNKVDEIHSFIEQKNKETLETLETNEEKVIKEKTEQGVEDEHMAFDESDIDSKVISFLEK